MDTRTDSGLDVELIVGSAYAAHAGPLLRRLTAFTRDPIAAEDLTQEAFLRLTAEVRAGRVPDDVAAWLHRVGRNLATSRGRRLTVAGRHRSELIEHGWARSPEDVTIEADEQRVVWAALGDLGRVDRHALVLAAHGYRGAEIARSIGRSEGATRTILCRARSRIRTQLLSAQPA